MSGNAYTINLNKDTFEELKIVQTELEIELGFEPTMGQVVRHLIALYNKG